MDAVRASRGVSVAFAPGTFTAVMGPSGSGKTTLLHCLAGMDRPSRGSAWWGGTEVSRSPERRLAVLRRSRVGFVFQVFNLMPAMTVAQNVALPGRPAGERPDRGRVQDAFGRVGLAGRERHRSGLLSGGQQQRVAIARALVSRPRCCARRLSAPGPRDGCAVARGIAGHCVEMHHEVVQVPPVAGGRGRRTPSTATGPSQCRTSTRPPSAAASPSCGCAPGWA